MGFQQLVVARDLLDVHRDFELGACRTWQIETLQPLRSFTPLEGLALELLIPSLAIPDSDGRITERRCPIVLPKRQGYRRTSRVPFQARGRRLGSAGSYVLAISKKSGL